MFDHIWHIITCIRSLSPFLSLCFIRISQPRYHFLYILHILLGVYVKTRPRKRPWDTQIHLQSSFSFYIAKIEFNLWNSVFTTLSGKGSFTGLVRLIVSFNAINFGTAKQLSDEGCGNTLNNSSVGMNLEPRLNDIGCIWNISDCDVFTYIKDEFKE